MIDLHGITSTISPGSVVIEVYNGSCGGLDSVACGLNNCYPSDGSQVSLRVRRGDHLYVRVGADSGEFKLQVAFFEYYIYQMILRTFNISGFFVCAMM